MRKKLIKFFSIVITIIILVILNNNTNIIKNTKKLINKKQVEFTNENITTINITNLKNNENIEHEHIYITKYNEESHWEECKICHTDKRNVVGHIFTNSWTMGTANNCHNNNVLVKSCNCGYTYNSTEGKKQHSKVRYINNAANFTGYNQCDDCICWWNLHKCYKSNGSRINCLNLGKCSICNYNYTSAIHYQWYWIEPDEISKKLGQGDTSGKYIVGNKIYCEACQNTYLGEVNRAEFIRESSNIFKMYITITLPNGSNYTGCYSHHNFGNRCNMTNSISRNGNVINDVVTITFNEHCEIASFATFAYDYTLNGQRCNVSIAKGFYVDSEKPKINNITYESTNEWKKVKMITITGTENYCNTVKIKILDDEENTIFEGETNVNNKNYTISCIPELEANNIGKTFKAVVTDNCENSIEQEFTISKVDSIPPEPISENEVGGDWAKTKNFTFKSKDRGIGNVQIAFNDISDLASATLNESGEYEREYEFTGDVYQPKELSALYKDELGNTTIQKITIDKLDNTAPTITNASIHNNKLSVEANDIKQGIGEGSGVAKYRYITSESKLENLEVFETATSVNVGEDFIIPNIDKVKYIYIVAEDLVGNISESYEYEVPQLILTSKVNLSAADGKGGVELDWSNYDLEDKYFVIYRKQENETEWENIVSLDRKLTEGKYTDTLGNDQTNPRLPNINIEGNNISNNIQINASAIDFGTKYQYYIESYDSTTGTLLNKSQ